LRDTIVDPAFRPPDDPATHLFDFVDEAGVNELYELIKQSMDRFDAARKVLLDTCGSFDNDLNLIRDTLDPAGDAMNREADNLLDDVSPFPSLLFSLETHATEVASHLEGLVKHYDLCVSALKSTEGGGEAISKASEGEADQHESKLAGFGLGITKLDDEIVPQFLSEEDRVNMLTVLVKDAGEVEDVVNEINDRLVDMEDQLAQIDGYMQKLRAMSSCLRSGLQVLKRVMDNVPVYISGCADFQAAWEDEKEVLVAKMEEMEGLSEFYSGFATGYDGLIIEVQRRRQVKREMEKIARNATSQIEKLYKGTKSHAVNQNVDTDQLEGDLEHRADFKADQGEYLPSDIWPGLMNPPVRYEITAIDDENNAIPELKKDVVEKALQRLAARAKSKA
jgi:autophagy-related protein 17